MFRNLFRLFLPLVIVATFAAPVQSQMPATGTASDHTASYVVKRDGSPIGTLKIGFNRDGERLVATSNYSIKVKLLAIVLYRYDKRMVETYQNGRLVAYETDIDDNGTKSQVRVTRDGDKLAIVHPKGNLTAPVGTYPSTYWPAATPNLTRMIDSSDGILLNVKTAETATEDLAIDGRTVKAKRYTMSGDLARELWYGADKGEWLKLKMSASDNSTIEIERDWAPVWKRDLL
jgi:hypothetical protein